MKSYSAKSTFYVIISLTIVLLGVATMSLKMGVIAISTEDFIGIIKQALFEAGNAGNNQLELIILHIRLPRLILGILVGAGLALCGAVMQALFRNPMADPGLLGVSSGAALGAVASIVFGLELFATLPRSFHIYLLPLCAFLGGLISLLIVCKLSHHNRQIDIPTMLLAGVAMNSIMGAMIGLLSYVADDGQLRDLVFWSLGSLEITNWNKIILALLVFLPCIVYILFQSQALNANLLGEREASYLGINIERLKISLILVISILVGLAVALSGIIGFIGLLVPHLLRLVLGADHRILLPTSMLFGAVLLVLADILARTLIAPAEIPIGIITAILGGPFFLFLLVKHRKNYFL